MLRSMPFAKCCTQHVIWCSALIAHVIVSNRRNRARFHTGSFLDCSVCASVQCACVSAWFDVHNTCSFSDSPKAHVGLHFVFCHFGKSKVILLALVHKKNSSTFQSYGLSMLDRNWMAKLFVITYIVWLAIILRYYLSLACLSHHLGQMKIIAIVWVLCEMNRVPHNTMVHEY